MKKIVIVSGIQIINNPRVVKEATLLSEAGYDVEVLSAIFDADSKDRIQRIVNSVSWRHIPIIDLSNNDLYTRIDYFLARTRRRIAFAAKKKYGFECSSQLGYFVKRLLKTAERRQADLYIVHLEQALWVGRELLKKGEKVAIDVEDWYSEDGLPEDRELRPIHLMKTCEAYLLKNAVYSSTTSIALAQALSVAYQCLKPKVVYNSFSASERNLIDGKKQDRKDTTIPSIIWFSQTIGPGRGLESLLVALNEIDLPFELHIRGTDRRKFSESLLGMAKKEIIGNIYFHPQVPQDELLSRLCEHDIGFCGDLSSCPSRDLTITNKMLEYLRAGLAVVASDTNGHKEVAEKVGGAVKIYRQNDLSSLSTELFCLLKDTEALALSKQKSKSSLDNEFGWEKSSEVLVDAVNSCWERVN